MPETERNSEVSRVQHLRVGGESAGQRLDNYLIRVLSGVPKTRLYRALRKGEVRVNKGRVKADYRLAEGDLVRIPPLRRAAEPAPPRVPAYWGDRILQCIVYESDDLLVIDKPSGIAVHGGSGLSFGLIEALRQLRPGDRYLELVHRLDRDTSGLIMIARRPAMLRELHRQLREDKIEKRYLALASGSWPKRLSRVEAPLEKNVLSSGERMVRVSREGKRAITLFNVKERFQQCTLIEASPVTGRTHQIRVHAQHAGHPLLGDEKYNDETSRNCGRDAGLRRLFLHASALTLTLPEQRELRLEAELDEELRGVLQNLRN